MMGMKKVTREDIEELETQLSAAPPGKVAQLVKKLVKYKRYYFRGK